MTETNRSAFAHLLFVSGLLGIALGMGVAFYQALLQDPILLGGEQAVPSWLTRTFFALLTSSLAVLFYASLLDRLFQGWFDVITGLAILGQWGFPVSLYLSTGMGAGNIAGLAVLICTLINGLVALAVLGNYLRREWPAIVSEAQSEH